MATASRSLCRILLRTSRAVPAKRKCISQYQRSFSAVAVRCDKSDPKIPQPVYFRDIDGDLADLEANNGFRRPTQAQNEEFQKLYNPDPADYLTPGTPLTLEDLTRDERNDYDALSSDQKNDYLPRLNHYKALSEATDREMDDDTQEKIIAYANRASPLNLEPPYAVDAKSGMGLWAEDEDDELGQTPDNDDDVDPSAITSVAESELQLHREIREYTRVAAWEMPLLTKLATQDFQAPTQRTPLRFRYTTYLGETHPAASKVVLEFTSTDLAASLKLTKQQTLKLTKLLGPRYNHVTDTARMSCERFDHAAQNKRYLGDLLESLVRESKEGKDLFEDIPRDDRHTKVKQKIRFPEGWLLNEQRVKVLAKERKAPVALQPPRNERMAESQERIAEYMQRMPLGRREEAGRLVAEAAREEVEVPVRR